MKKLLILALVVLALIPFSACKKTPDSENTSTTKPSTSSELTAADLFGNNGTESEYNITSSEVKELFQNQEDKEKDETSSKTTSSKNESKVNSLKQETTSSKVDSSKISTTSEQNNKFDLDSDGWTDGWK